MRLRLVDYTLKLLGLSEAMRKWHGLLVALDGEQRENIARFAEQIAGTLAPAAVAFEQIERDAGAKPADGLPYVSSDVSEDMSKILSARSTAGLMGADSME